MGADGKSKEKAAKKFNVGTRTVDRAQSVIKHGPRYGPDCGNGEQAAPSLWPRGRLGA
jgi:hypothetical protein